MASRVETAYIKSSRPNSYIGYKRCRVLTPDEMTEIAAIMRSLYVSHNDRSYTQLDDRSFNYLNTNPHYMCYSTFGKKYVILFTRIDSQKKCIVIHRRTNYFYEIPLTDLNDEIYSNTIFEGELIQHPTISRRWDFIMTDLLTYKNTPVQRMHFIKRYTLLHTLYTSDIMQNTDVMHFQVKEYYPMKYLRYVLDNVTNQVYKVSGILFKNSTISTKDLSLQIMYTDTMGRNDDAAIVATPERRGQHRQTSGQVGGAAAADGSTYATTRRRDDESVVNPVRRTIIPQRSNPPTTSDNHHNEGGDVEEVDNDVSITPTTYVAEEGLPVNDSSENEYEDVTPRTTSVAAAATAVSAGASSRPASLYCYFVVRPTDIPDNYALYTCKDGKTLSRHGFAYISTLDLSRFMLRIFYTPTFVPLPLRKDIIMQCEYNTRFNKWTPIQQSEHNISTTTAARQVEQFLSHS